MGFIREDRIAHMERERYILSHLFFVYTAGHPYTGKLRRAQKVGKRI